MAPRHSVRVGHAVTVQPLAEILGFADVENNVICVAHEIHAGALRQLSEEVASQPLDERLRIRKEKLLSRRHRGDSTILFVFFSFRRKLELMPPGLGGGALFFQHIVFFFIQCGQ